MLFRTFVIGLFVLLSGVSQHAMAARQAPQAADSLVQKMDSAEFGLLTCAPHEEIYSLYGHTAIHFRNHRTRENWVANYGVFNFRAPYFTLRFTFGLTDYWLEPVPFYIFEEEYRHFGSMVIEQVLNLTNEEKLALYMAIYENAKPENCEYRYNVFYDNCTTRARDIIERCINGQVNYHPRKDYEPTYRQIVGEKTRNHPWATFGNDFLLGVKADTKPTQRGQEFLPENLMRDFAQAQIATANGQSRALVKEERVIVEPGVQIIQQDFPLTPTECACILLVISLLIIAIELKKKTVFKWWDATLMLIQGLMGCVLFIMLFSQHPTTSTNLQLLLFNPLPLFFIHKIIRGRKTCYWKILPIMAILFYIGAIWQHYAEGTTILALCLLIRYWPNLRNATK